MEHPLFLCIDSSLSELIERHPVGANTSRGHLYCQLRSCVEATCVEVRVKQSVVVRDVQAIETLHLLYLHLLEEVNSSTARTRSGTLDPLVSTSPGKRKQKYQ